MKKIIILINSFVDNTMDVETILDLDRILRETNEIIISNQPTTTKKQLNKRKRKWNEISVESKNESVTMKELDKNESKRMKLSQTVDEWQPGFRDADFHFVDETDNGWQITYDGLIKNEILTELILSKKEIEMINENFNLN